MVLRIGRQGFAREERPDIGFMGMLGWPYDFEDDLSAIGDPRTVVEIGLKLSSMSDDDDRKK